MITGSRFLFHYIQQIPKTATSILHYYTPFLKENVLPIQGWQDLIPSLPYIIVIFLILLVNQIVNETVVG